MLKNQFTNIEKTDLNHFIHKRRFKPEKWQIITLLMITTLLFSLYVLFLVYIYKNFRENLIESTFIVSIILLIILRYLIYNFFTQLHFKNLGHFTNRENCRNEIVEALNDICLEVNIEENGKTIYANFNEHFPVNYNVQLFFILDDDGHIYFNARRSDKKIIFNKSEKINRVKSAITKKNSRKPLS